MPTVITLDNVPAILAQIAERQDELDARLETLTTQLADQAIRTGDQDEQLRVQAAALRATATQLSMNIRDVARAPKRNGNGNGSDGNGAGNPSGNNGNSNRNGSHNGNGGARTRTASAESQTTGRRQRQAEAETAVAPPSEPESPGRPQRAHRWI